MFEVNPNSGPSVFLSYSSADGSFARTIGQYFERVGVNVFFAEDSIRKGEIWSQRVLSELRSCDCVLFFVSVASVTSPYVQQELGAAIVNDKKLVPVMWESSISDLPGWAARYQCLDLRGKDEAGQRTASEQLASELFRDHSSRQAARMDELEKSVKKEMFQVAAGAMPIVGPLVLSYRFFKMMKDVSREK